MQNCLTRRIVLPIGQFLRLAFHCGEVAQLGEHRLRKAGVEGSNPFFSTTISRGYLIKGNPFFVFPTPFPTRALKNRNNQYKSLGRDALLFGESEQLADGSYPHPLTPFHHFALLTFRLNHRCHSKRWPSGVVLL